MYVNEFIKLCAHAQHPLLNHVYPPISGITLGIKSFFQNEISAFVYSQEALILGNRKKLIIAKQSLIAGAVNLIALPVLGLIGGFNKKFCLLQAKKLKKFIKNNRHIIADHKLSTRDIKSPSNLKERCIHSLRGILLGPSLLIEGVSNIILAIGSEKHHELLYEKGLFVMLSSLLVPPAFIISGLLKRKTSM